MNCFMIIAYLTWTLVILMTCCATQDTLLVIHFLKDGKSSTSITLALGEHETWTLWMLHIAQRWLPPSGDETNSQATFLHGLRACETFWFPILPVETWCSRVQYKKSCATNTCGRVLLGPEWNEPTSWTCLPTTFAGSFPWVSSCMSPRSFNTSMLTKCLRRPPSFCYLCSF